MRALKLLSNRSGVALLVAITAIAMVAFIAVELSYDTTSEYIIAAQEINRLKARYAAKAGVEVSLLRLNIYRQAQEQFGQLLGPNRAVLEQVWSVPFVWPPVLPGEASGVDKANMDEIVNDSLMDATYNATISSEGSKIDLIDLISPSKKLREITKVTLVRLIENKLANDTNFAESHRDLNAEEIVNNIIDWMDADSQSLNSGSESSHYSDIEDATLPPNQPFKTLEELHMVAGITDELYEFLAPQVTIFGLKAIQVNHASRDILMSLAPVITEEIADRIIERRNGDEGPFKDDKDFLNFLSSIGINTQGMDESLPPMVFDSEFNFRIQSIGSYGQTSSEIVAIVYDFDKVKERLTDSLKKDGDDSSRTPPPTNEKKESSGKNTKPKGRARIVYWSEN